MQVQINTDNQIPGDAERDARIEKEVASALERFGDRLTRVEIHLSDLDGNKSGGNDKRCVMEARPTGLRPLAVTSDAPTVEQAIRGAVDKLRRALDKTLGKLQAR